MFRDREDAACRLADELGRRELHDPLILAIPRGGVLVGAVLARELDAELDVVLSRKLRAPWQPEFAIGAISEDGQVFLNPQAEAFDWELKQYLPAERQRQLAEIGRRRSLIRAVRPPAARISDRSVIVTDDGIATGSTMIAALQSIKPRNPRELIVAVPVAAPGRLDEVRHWCDDVICLSMPVEFRAVGEFYEDFTPVDDHEVVELLREFAAAPRPAELARARSR